MSKTPTLIDEAASNYSKSNITYWLIAGVIYAFIAGGHVLLNIFLLFLPGVFVISFISIPFFQIRLQKYKHVPNTTNVLVLAFFTITSIVDFLMPIVAAILAVMFLNQF